jgi:hypothetical protein
VGSEHVAICTNCGTRCTVREGGGFFFEIVHCERCGRAKSVGFDELGSLSPIQGADTQSEAYRSAVERIAGRHRCSGHYRLKAPPRCPRCRSTDLEVDLDGPFLQYD